MTDEEYADAVHMAWAQFIEAVAAAKAQGIATSIIDPGHTQFDRTTKFYISQVIERSRLEVLKHSTKTFSAKLD